MKNPTFYVGYPDLWIRNRPWFHEDNIALYKNIEKVLQEYDCQYEFGKIKYAPSTHDIVLAQHTTITRNNVWNLKKGYLPGYMYWDRNGYSGWAEMANSRKLFEKSQQVNLGEAARFVAGFGDTYIRNDISKFPQSRSDEKKTAIEPNDGEFISPEKYVFVACQRPNDTVARLSRLDTAELPFHVVRAFRNSGYTVVIKRHPQATELDISELAREPHVVFSQHSIHQIIPNASAVITVNSGVGFEALLHRKPVYTTGHCDYHWVTGKLNSIEDLERLACDLDRPYKEDEIVKFMYYMLTEYFVDAFDTESVRQRIDRCIEEWKKGWS